MSCDMMYCKMYKFEVLKCGIHSVAQFSENRVYPNYIIMYDRFFLNLAYTAPTNDRWRQMENNVRKCLHIVYNVCTKGCQL